MKFIPFLLFIFFFGVGCNKSGEAGTDANGQGKWPQQTPLPAVTGEAGFQLSPSDLYVNVMQNSMPRMPNFPSAKQKQLMMNGYVADLTGKPVEGAFIGLRSQGTVYIAASTETDANGYYEMNIPLGGADIYVAGHAIQYGNGKAALSLYPADGRTSLTNPGAGVIKNFVVMSYGLADEDERNNNPGFPSGYFGGALMFDYVLHDPLWEPTGLPEGAEVEIKLTPVTGTTLYGEAKSFTIVRTIGNGNGFFNVNNIPVGQYNITARLKDGRQLKMKQTGPHVTQYPNHGLQPKEGTGTATVWFTAMTSDRKAPPVNYGYWRTVPIKLSLQ